jgi:DNA polymerase-3 subunit alpha
LSTSTGDRSTPWGHGRGTYGLITAQTAYLKAHYPLEYMAAVLTSYTGKTDSIVRYIAACNHAGIKVLPPDVNSSGRDFTAVPNEGIRFGLAGIRGVGEAVVDAIVAARDADGPYVTLHDFCARVEMRALTKKTLEALIKAGAFDSTGYTRKHLMSLMDECVDSASKRQKDRDAGQTSMFDLLDAQEHGFSVEIPEPNGDEWDKKMKLAFEKEMLGIYVSDHPLREIEETIRAASEVSCADLEEVTDGSTVWVAGLVSSVVRKPTKRGTMMAIATFEDLEGSVEMTVFPQVFDKFRDVLVEDAVLRVKARVENSDQGLKLLVADVEPFNGTAFAPPPGRITVHTDVGALGNGRSQLLTEILERFPGSDVVELLVDDGEREVVFAMPQKVDRRSGALRAELMELFGGSAVGA